MWVLLGAMHHWAKGGLGDGFDDSLYPCYGDSVVYGRYGRIEPLSGVYGNRPMAVFDIQGNSAKRLTNQERESE